MRKSAGALGREGFVRARDLDHPALRREKHAFAGAASVSSPPNETVKGEWACVFGWTFKIGH